MKHFTFSYGNEHLTGVSIPQKNRPLLQKLLNKTAIKLGK
jgi:hypothetical protein